MPDEPIRIRTGVAVNYIAASIQEDEMDGPLRSEWEAMTEDERDEYLNEVALETLHNHADCWAFAEDD